MGTEPRSGELAASFPFGRVVAVWMSIMLAETAHGVVREIFIAPAIGDLHARQVGVAIGCVFVFIIAWSTIRWMRVVTARAQIQAGVLWVVLTLAFEILLGLALNLGWARILSDYDPARGGFMLAGLVFMLFAPRLTAKMRRV
jgi:hypothetical protein